MKITQEFAIAAFCITLGFIASCSGNAATCPQGGAACSGAADAGTGGSSSSNVTNAAALLVEEPCGSATCTGDTWCNSDKSACEDNTTGDLSKRSKAIVCAHWNARLPVQKGQVWSGNAAAPACELGTFTDRALTVSDTLRRINTFRWLVGINANVVEDPDQYLYDQNCAMTQFSNGDLSHSPKDAFHCTVTPAAGQLCPADKREPWWCVNDASATGAGTSNISMASSNPSDAIEQFIRDSDSLNATILGHRRWILHQTLGKVGIGFAGTPFGATCLGIFDSTGSVSRAWAAFPAPGPAPKESMIDPWTFIAPGVNFAGATVTVDEVLADNTKVSKPVSSYLPSPGFGDPAIAWHLMGWQPEVGKTYLVTVNYTGGSTNYTITVVDCAT